MFRGVVAILFVSIFSSFFMFSYSRPLQNDFSCIVRAGLDMEVAHTLGLDLYCEFISMIPDPENHGNISYSINKLIDSLSYEDMGSTISRDDIVLVVVWLIENGYDIFKNVDGSGYSYFTSLLGSDASFLVDEILSSPDVNMDDEVKYSVLLHSCNFADYLVVENLIENRNVDLNHNISSYHKLPGPYMYHVRPGDSCIHIAARRGEYDMVIKLFENGSNVDLMNDNGETARSIIIDSLYDQIYIYNMLSGSN